jgi:hypothetical protein
MLLTFSLVLNACCKAGIHAVLLRDSPHDLSFANVCDSAKKVVYVSFSVLLAIFQSFAQSLSVQSCCKSIFSRIKSLNVSSCLVNIFHSIFPAFQSLSKPNHPAIFLVFSLMILLPHENENHQGRTGTDFAISSANQVSFFICSSIGHPPIVRESLTNRRIRNNVNKSTIS